MDTTLYAKWTEAKVESITQSASSVGIARGTLAVSTGSNVYGKYSSMKIIQIQK